MIRRHDVRGAWHTRVKAAQGPQNVNPSEIFGLVELLENRGFHHGLLVGAGVAPRVSRGGVDGAWCANLVVGDCAVFDDQVV